MGHVYAEVKIGDPGKQITQAMLVDTGATYMCLPEQLAQKIGVHPERYTEVSLADGTRVKAGIALSPIEMNGRQTVVQVLIFNIVEPVVGAFTLEALGLAVDPVSGELKPTRSFITRA